MRITAADLGTFVHVPASIVQRARFIPVPWLPMGTAAMTFGRNVLIQRKSMNDLALIAHELVHVRQWKELGRLRFLYRYLKEYSAGRLSGRSHWEAYLEISFERAAREEISGLTLSAPEREDRPFAE